MIKRMGKSLQIVIKNNIFDIILFQSLFQIRDKIFDLNFDIKDARIRQIIEKHRLTFLKI